MKFKNHIHEAFTFKKNDPGQTKFSNSGWNDPHIKAILPLVAKGYNMSEAEFVDLVNEVVDSLKPIHDASKILSEQMEQNIIETTVFKAFWDGEVRIFNPNALTAADIDAYSNEETTDEEKKKIRDKVAKTIKGDMTKMHYGVASKFSPRVFMMLNRIIQSEHSQFFPLRNFTDGKYLYNPRIVLVPSDDASLQRFNFVDTAAATPDGNFIFNTHLMQKLIDWAHLKGVKPAGKKYASNGGPIPDDWCYIEFVIMHEYMHFSYGDFHYDKILKPRNGKKPNQKIINYVGDYRSNYLMLKSGFEQLPFGLFSDHINYDRQNSYQEMYDLIEDELKKLPQDERVKAESTLDDNLDEHGNGDGDDDGDEGDGEPNGKGKGSNKQKSNNEREGEGDGEGDEKGKGGDGKGKEKSKSKSKKVKPGEFDPNEVDKAHEEIERKMGNKGDSGSDPGTDINNSGSGDGTFGRFGNPGTGMGGGRGFDPNSVKPHYSWRAIINQAVKVNSPPEETYQKPSRRSITGAVIATQRGSAAVKPGEIATNGDIKLLLIIDDSGSMSVHNSKVYANIAPLIKGKGVVPKFLIMKFSGSYSTYEADVRKNTAKEIHTGKTTTVSTLLSTAESGGTVLSNELVEEVKNYIKKQYNVILVSDTDVLHGDNLHQLKELIDLKAFVLFATKEDFTTAVTTLKTMSNRISHL